MRANNHQRGDQEDDGSVVVLELGCGVPNSAAIDAAMLLAKTLASDIEGLFIEDTSLVDAATYSFTREITFFGGRNRSITTERVVAEMQSRAMAMRQRLQDIARAYNVTLRYRILQRTSERTRPVIGRNTRFLALSQPQPQLTASGRLLSDIIEHSPTIEGFLVAGAAARRRKGPILLVVHAADDLAHLQTTVRFLAQTRRCGVLILPTVADPRLMSGIIILLQSAPLPQVRLLAPAGNTAHALENVVSRSDASLLALDLTHPLAAPGRPLMQLAGTLSTPLLLLRGKPEAVA